MCDRIVSDYPFSLRYDPNRYKAQQMCNKIVDDSLAALKFVSDWFVTNKMIKKLFTACPQMKMYSILMKILVMSHLFIMEWVFLI